MSSNVVYSCAPCSKTVMDKQRYAIKQQIVFCIRGECIVSVMVMV
jgi:hypothetical protein